MAKSEIIRVAFFAEILIENFDGAARTMHQIIQRIPKDRFEFLFICGVGPDQDIDHKIITIPSIQVPINKSYTMAMPLLGRKKLVQALQDFNADIIHIATPSPLGHYAKNYGRAHGIPILSVYHTHFLSYVDYYLRKIKFLIPTVKNTIINNMKSFYDNCDTIYVPTTHMIDDLRRHGFKTDHMELWQRGIDRRLFTPTKRDQGLIHQITRNNKKNILFVSRLVWEKNVETLIDIYQKLQSEHPEYNLIIAGDGVARQALELSMPNAYFTGMLSHSSLSYLYASADVFLFTSDTESYGNVVVEALSSGLPCVIAHGGGSRSFIEQGQNGYTCAVHNANDYVQRISEILENDALRSKLSENARMSTLGMNWEELTDRYFAKLTELSYSAFSLSEIA